MKNTDQLRDKIKHLTKQTGLTHEVVLRNYMLERVLERIAVSPYRTNFILKGGILIASLVGIEARTTMDLDANLTRQTLNEEALKSIMKTIMNQKVEDTVTFTFQKIEVIREVGDYPGFRVTLLAQMEKIRHFVKLDIATGDTVFPKEVEYSYPMMFENRTIPLMAYNVETVLAEKLETILVRATLNTRMRDFYDVYILQHTLSMNDNYFIRAFQSTTKTRDTEQVTSQWTAILTSVSTSSDMQQMWRRYQKSHPYSQDISWETITEAVWILASKLE